MRKQQLILIVIVVALIVAVFALLVMRQPKSSSQSSETVTISTDQPSEEPLKKAGYVWRGGPDDPKKITIQSINVDTYIQKVGVDQNSQIAVPTNINLTGWFVEGARPGEAGLSVIDGHFDGYSSDGVFARLTEVKADDEVRIEMGNGEMRTFRVKRVTTVKTEAAAAELFSQDPTISSQLSLITCGGAFDDSKRSYDQRIIVVTERIDS